MNLDIPTLMVTIIVTSSAVAIALAAVAYRRSRVMLAWSGALALHAFTYGLFVLRGQISDLISILLANVALVSGLTLFVEGILLFQQRRARHWLIWLPVVVLGLSFSFLLDAMQARLVISGVICAGLTATALITLIQRRHETSGRGQYILMTGFLFATLIFLARIVGTLTGQMELATFLANNQIQTLTFLTAIIDLTLLSIGMVLMIHERAEHELFQNREILRQQNATLKDYSDELKDANRKLEALSITDGLTGLYNRRHFDEVLAAEWARARRAGEALVILMIDIDLFKRYNDCYGHQAGDDCLIKVAGALQGGARRSGDMSARYGGEEFVVIASDTDLVQAKVLGESLCQAVESMEIPHAQSPFGKVTVSIGVAAMIPGGETSAEALVFSADEALYRAKNAGRNQVAVG
ncbi:GGDEF domain-containing protein [Lacisediminimonas profundi]|uniref:GGDEF domain-containing protein n=1 Tax=Lacisediminimonas profundi TaxID=2603856 RepID=UPI0013870FB5|nr:diguanylate cyclase [Lacisediminimonas profundi]